MGKRTFLAIFAILVLAFPIVAEATAPDRLDANASFVARVCDSVVLGLGNIFHNPTQAEAVAQRIRAQTKPFIDASKILNDSSLGSALIQKGDFIHGIALFDANGDNRTDIYITHDNRPIVMRNSSLAGITPNLSNKLYINTGNGPDGLPRFVETSAISRVQDLGKRSSGVAVGDYDNDGRLDLYVTNWLDGTITQDQQRQPRGYKPTYGFYNPGEAGNILYHNDGNILYTLPDGRIIQVPVFSDRTSAAGVSGGNHNTDSAEWVDINRDGYLDLFVVNSMDIDYAGQRYLGLPTRKMLGEPNQLFLNNGDGTFANITAKAGVAGQMLTMYNPIDEAAQVNSPTLRDSLDRPVNPTGQLSHHAVWFDYDRDGFPDLFVANDQNPIGVYHNNGDLTFTDVTSYTNLNVEGGWMDVGFLDLNGDGKMDLFATNVGANTFSKPIVLSNGTVRFTRYDALFRNDGVLTKEINGKEIPIPLFTYVSHQVTVQWSPRLQPTGTTLSPVCHSSLASASGLEWGEFGWGAVFPDVNNSGYPDIYWVGGTLRCDPAFRTYCLDSPGRLLINTGNNIFVDTSVEAHVLNLIGVNYATGDRMNLQLGEMGSGLSTGDLNGDGFPDIVVSNAADYTPYGHDLTNSFIHGELVAVPSFLFINPGGTNGWIKIKLQGTTSNWAGIGAEIRVTRTDGKVLTQFVLSGDVTGGQTDMVKIFGLGHAGVSKVEVIWPSGIVDSLSNIQTNQLIKVIEGTHMLSAQGFGA